MTTILYLRKGRKVRATGRVIDFSGGFTKVKPNRDDWGAVWLHADEIAAGKSKPPIIPRKPCADDKPKRERKPTPAPVPRWQELVQRVRIFETDHLPDGFPGVTMRFLTELADELEAAQTIFQPKP